MNVNLKSIAIHMVVSIHLFLFNVIVQLPLRHAVVKVKKGNVINKNAKQIQVFLVMYNSNKSHNVIGNCVKNLWHTRMTVSLSPDLQET